MNFLNLLSTRDKKIVINNEYLVYKSRLAIWEADLILRLQPEEEEEFRHYLNGELN